MEEKAWVENAVKKAKAQSEKLFENVKDNRLVKT